MGGSSVARTIAESNWQTLDRITRALEFMARKFEFSDEKVEATQHYS
jgi:hypothetical protein